MRHCKSLCYRLRRCGNRDM